MHSRSFTFHFVFCRVCELCHLGHCRPTPWAGASWRVCWRRSKIIPHRWGNSGWQHWSYSALCWRQWAESPSTMTNRASLFATQASLAVKTSAMTPLHRSHMSGSGSSRSSSLPCHHFSIWVMRLIKSPTPRRCQGLGMGIQQEVEQKVGTHIGGQGNFTLRHVSIEQGTRIQGRRERMTQWSMRYLR